MKKLLIIGASILQLPAIKKAKEMGFFVAVADYNPKAVGIKFADKYFNVSTNDVEGIKAVAKDFSPDGIMTLATDMPMRSIAAATKICGLPGIEMETAINATDKEKMIQVFEKFNVAHPWYYVAHNENEFNLIKGKIDFPCILKPTDSSGSRGVVLVDNLDDLNEAYKYTISQAKEGNVILEEYLVGQEVSVEIMVVDSVPYVLQVTDKLTTGSPYFVEMRHNQPSMLSKDAVNSIEKLARDAVKAIAIKNGPAHVEIMLTKNGPKMIELGARMGGDCITTHLVPLSTGIDMIKTTIELACGLKTDITRRYNKASAIQYFDSKKGVIKNIVGIENARKIKGVKQIEFVYEIGESVSDIKNSSDRIGFVIAQGETPEEAIRICEKAISMIKIEIA